MKWFRTAGVPVSWPVYRAVRAGDRARDERDWATASRCYRRALARNGGLYHIWVQLGHALKEHGDLDGARDAYEHAQLLAPMAADPSLHIGHVRKLQGDPGAAGHHYLAALRKEPLHPDALRELRALLGRGELRGIGRADLERAGMRFPGSPARRPKRARAAAASRILVDLSDLVIHLGQRRHPTGIQRVQIGVASALIEDSAGRDVRFCAYVPGRHGWCELPPALVAGLSDRDSAHWEERLDELRLLLATADLITPSTSDILLNLGSSWSLDGYLEAIEAQGFGYAPFIHDLIAVTNPELCDADVARQFRAWLDGALDLADHLLVNSRATLDALLTFAEESGHPIDRSAVTVIPLDADFRSSEPIGDQALQRWSLTPGGYVLFVGTIEPRKNHMLAFDAWERLLATHGADAAPPLVCVGGQGWLSDGIFARLAASGALKAHVRMLHDVSDEELAQLYRHCLFTLYPSEDEGWGLPITEALCHGKIPLIAAASSVREAGAGIASSFAPGSPDDLVARLEELLFDPDHRAAREDQVRRQFHPRAWSAIATQILDSLAPPNASAPEHMQPSSPGRWSARLRARGDRARDGKDWNRAIDAYSAYLVREPADFAIWVQLGHCLKEAGLPEDALDAYGKAAALDGQDADLHLHLGHVYKILGRPAEAIAAYRTSAAIDPGRGEALGECAWLEERFSSFGAAETRLDRLIELIERRGETKGDIFADYFASFDRPRAARR